MNDKYSIYTLLWTSFTQHKYIKIDPGGCFYESAILY